MANDSNAPSGTDAPTTPQGQQPPVTPSTPPAGAPPTATPTGEIQNPEAYKYAQEAAELRKRVKAFEDAEKKRSEADLSETQKLTQRVETAEAKLLAARNRVGATELKSAAQTAGIIDPDVAAALLGARVEYDDEGEPKNIAKLVDDLKASKPHLFTDATATPNAPPKHPSSGGASNAGRAAGNGGLTEEMIKSWTPQERIARVGELRAFQEQLYKQAATQTKVQ